jgi:hypothetical protein
MARTALITGAVSGIELESKAVAIHCFMNYLMANNAQFARKSLVVKIVGRIQDK